MGAFKIKKYTFAIVLVLFASFVLAGCNKEESTFSEEEQQLVDEARAVIKEFNQIYIADSQEEFETIIENTWVDADGVIDSMQEFLIKDSHYNDMKIEFSNESIIISEDRSEFKYEANTNVTLTDKNDNSKTSYDKRDEYEFKNC